MRKTKVKVKRKLSQSEEFEIMKLVLDKVLWLGFIIMGYGLYVSITGTDYKDGIYYLAAGAVVLIIFAWFVVKEFERIR